jgi:hypothetical protein
MGLSPFHISIETVDCGMFQYGCLMIAEVMLWSCGCMMKSACIYYKNKKEKAPIPPFLYFAGVSADWPFA